MIYTLNLGGECYAMVVRFPREQNAKLKQLHAEAEPERTPCGKAATGEL